MAAYANVTGAGSPCRHSAAQDSIVASPGRITGIVRKAALLAAIALVSSASAQGTYPNRQITIVVGFSAGGSTDIVARLLAEEMRKSWGQPVIIDNRPGAGGNIGASMVAKAKPDGYTLLMGSVGPLAINASLYASMPYDNLKDFTPISLVVHVPNMLVVNPRAMPVQTFAEFVALLKANPGRYFYASTGTGTSSHLSGELLKTMAGVEITHVPYKGAVALNDLLVGDQVHFMFATIPSVIEFVRAGRLRALAVTSKNRSAAVPQIPTVAESGFPEFEASSWFGLLGPAELPRDIVLKLQGETARALKIPELRDTLVQQGADPVASTPEEFAAYMRSETAKWAKVVRASGAKAD
ncbi:MAG TPA: tripartite tricarboxylate transporter substrate binding protein [Casimicrobiaceae bacterium]|nr:tripartite tricarboxylate transporter substrate binding protein [Casimicrobiaceae bacterium]